MLHNYFIIAFRNLLRHKIFSFINILGLAIGITCCMLLALFIASQKTTCLAGGNVLMALP